jgi:hypothetical protein
MTSRIGPVPGREPDACRVRHKRLSRFLQFGWHAAALVDNAKQVLPVKTLQAGRISVGWLAAECDECLIVGAAYHDLLPDAAL